MDLSAGAISAYTQDRIIGQVQVAVDAKVLNFARQQGAAALQLLQSATQSSGGAGDPLTAAATGLGGQLDTLA